MHVDGSPIFEVGSPPTRCTIDDAGLRDRLITVSDARRVSAESPVHVVASSHRMAASLTTPCCFVYSLVRFVSTFDRLATMGPMDPPSALRDGLDLVVASPPCARRMRRARRCLVVVGDRIGSTDGQIRRLGVLDWLIRAFDARRSPSASTAISSQSPVCERDIPLLLCHIR